MLRPYFFAFVAILGLSAVGRLWAQDRVRYYDPAQKKEVEANGTIEKESPGGVVVGSRTIPASDIVDVVYDSLRKGKLDYTSAVGKERTAFAAATKEDDRKKALGDALAGYKDALKAAPAGAAAARRHLQFRLAMLLARQADDDPAQLEAAIKELKDFKDKHPESWQIVPCARALARLQVKANRVEEARKTYEDLARVPNISRDIQQECDLAAAEALMHDASKYAEAERKLQAIVQGLPADDPQREKVQVYLARCAAAKGKDQFTRVEEELRKTIDHSKDDDLKALAYNTLGDCYLLHGQTKDAMYAYLWVDLIYHQNKEQHLKAVSQLAKVFADLKDEKRAKEYQEKAKREK
jgi:tetratricopeptide (TPR) repeat protein